MGEGQRLDGSQLRTRAARIAARNIVGGQPVSQCRRGAAKPMTAIDDAAVAKTSRRRPGRQRARAGRTFVAPNLAAVVVFTLFPLGFSLYMSLQNWDLFGPARFVGLRNFIDLFTVDPLFAIA